MEIPDEVKWLLPIVVGESWPEGDEDLLRDLRDAWHRAAEAIPDVSSTADQGASSVIGVWTGESAAAFERAWRGYVDGDEAYFTSLTEACRALGDACDATALDVEYTKYLIIASLIMLAISIAAMIASAAVTFGASTAGIVPAQIATRMTVQMIFRQLLQKLAQQGFKKVAQQVLQRVLREVATNVAAGVALDAGIQALQVASGDRKSWDWDKTKDAAVGGAVEGVVGAASNAVPGGATRGLSGSVGGEAVDSAVRAATRGAVEGAVTTVGEAAATGNLDQLSAKDVLMGASSGAVDRATGGTTDPPNRISTPSSDDVSGAGDADAPSAPEVPDRPASRSTSDSTTQASALAPALDRPADQDAPASTTSTTPASTAQATAAPASPSPSSTAQAAFSGPGASAPSGGSAPASSGTGSSGGYGRAPAAPQGGGYGMAPAPAQHGGFGPQGHHSDAGRAGNLSAAGTSGQYAPPRFEQSAPPPRQDGPPAQHGGLPSNQAGGPPPRFDQAPPPRGPMSGPMGAPPQAYLPPPQNTPPQNTPLQSTPPQHGGSQYGGSQYGGPQHGGPQHGGPQHTNPQSAPPQAPRPGGFEAVPRPQGAHNAPFHAPPAQGNFPGAPPLPPQGMPQQRPYPGGFHNAPPRPFTAPPPHHAPQAAPPHGTPQARPQQGPPPNAPAAFPTAPPPGRPQGMPPRHHAPQQPPARPVGPVTPPPRGPQPQRPVPGTRGPLEPPQRVAPPPAGNAADRPPTARPVAPASGAPRTDQPVAGRSPAPTDGPPRTDRSPTARVAPGDTVAHATNPPHPDRPATEPPAPAGGPTTDDAQATNSRPQDADQRPQDAEQRPQDAEQRPVDAAEQATPEALPDPVPDPVPDPEADRTPQDTGPDGPQPDPVESGTAGPDEDYLFDPDHRATAADNAALLAAIKSDERRRQIQSNALANRDASDSLSGLSDEGAIALYTYTGHDIFDAANTAHRLGPEAKDGNFAAAQLQIRAIVSAINELPPAELDLVRGINVGGNPALAKLIADQYVPGRTTVEPTVVSASIKESPDFVSRFGEDVEIHIQAKTARDIHELSQNDGEREAVSKPATQWYTHEKEVVRVEHGGTLRQKVVIRVEEVLPGDPRYLDRDAAEREMADRRAANRATKPLFDAAYEKSLRERLGGPVAPETPDAPDKTAQPDRTEQQDSEAQSQSSAITDRLSGKGYAGADASGGPLPHTAPTGGHDWSPLARATNPPAEAAIHADTANANQAAGYVAERHPHLAGVNPRFHDADAFERGYQTNCTRGVVASALRRAGVDVEAGPLRPEDMAEMGTLDYVRDRLGGEWQSHAGYDEVIRAMRERPLDSRAVIAVKYRGPDGAEYGHVAEVVHTGEGVAFVDPQTGSLMRLPHPPLQLDLLPYDLDEVAERHARTESTGGVTGDSGYGTAAPDERPLPTREDVNRYLHEPRVQEAMRVADAISHRDPDARIAVDGEEAHLGEAIAALLPRHPELARLLRDTPFLEDSLLARPQTLANLLRHPEAIDVLLDCVDEVRDHGEAPENDQGAPADESDGEPAPEQALLTPEQRALSDRARDLARRVDPAELVQDGFDAARKDDPEYQREYLDELYRDWRTKQDRLHALAHAVAEASGGVAFSRQTEKSRVRAADKIAEYRGDAAKLTDLVGSKIQYETVADAYAGLGALLDRIAREGSGVSVVKFRDRFLNPQDSGYRDLQLSVRLELDDGTSHVAELRLHVVAMDEVADFEHALYEVRRDFQALADDRGRTMTGEERALIGSILARERRLFGEAFARARGTAGGGDR
ncbi:WXG100-like domain-containing protein [Saccharothrix coeruleofusca]|uniref:WXG100-like domain-containing protein n=1 Tax=Saccharothrix coeruleofusca TaxID=33919 RepID=UPI001FD37FC8|nr:toxin glutamine deamidase domain-containing protein [Saccharothrix coeruleofusca]